MKVNDNFVMVDLETMGAGRNSVIVAIGAVMYTDNKRVGSFYRNVELQSCLNAGLTVDGSTVMWWLDQVEAARQRLRDTPYRLDEALTEFSTWLGDCMSNTDYDFYGNGASFDLGILANAYESVGFGMPWQFWQERCYRTIKNWFPDIPAGEFKGVPHYALDDAAHQARHLSNILSLANFENFVGEENE